MASTPPYGQIYDSIAKDNDIAWKVPACRILLPVLDKTLRELGHWEGASVLDLACGTGTGLRAMKRLGATKFVGVDISSEMLKVGRSVSPNESFELHHADCSQPLDHLGLHKGSFDIVIGMWLLNYAESREMIGRMWQNITAYLKPGGKFVGIIQNQDVVHPTSMQGKLAEYGAEETDIRDLPSGDGIRMHVHFDTQPKVEFDTFVVRKEIFEEEAVTAGLKDLRYIRPGPEVKGEVEGKSDAWWKELLEEYPNQIVIAALA